MRRHRRQIQLGIMAISLLFMAMTCESYYMEDGKQYGIKLINRTENPIWVEWNPYYPMVNTDSLFRGFQVKIDDEFVLTPNQHFYWENELGAVPFVRIFLFDASYNSISNHPDSLRAFQNEHLVYQHWYTKKELDSLGWKIYYPPLEIE